MAISPVPKHAGWTERDETRTEGIVVKEVSVEERFRWGDYCKSIQLIRLELHGGKRLRKPTHVIRCAYYFKDHGRPKNEYRWGSQTTLIVSRANFGRLVREAEKNGLLD